MSASSEAISSDYVGDDHYGDSDGDGKDTSVTSPIETEQNGNVLERYSDILDAVIAYKEQKCEPLGGSDEDKSKTKGMCYFCGQDFVMKIELLRVAIRVCKTCFVHSPAFQEHRICTYAARRLPGYEISDDDLELIRRLKITPVPFNHTSEQTTEKSDSGNHLPVECNQMEESLSIVNGSDIALFEMSLDDPLLKEVR
jgi:hypothetical protein